MRLWSHREAEEHLLHLLPPDMVLPGNRLVLGLGGVTQIDSLDIGVLVATWTSSPPPSSPTHTYNRPPRQQQALAASHSTRFWNI
jgi:anti-anti-sigma regulatory factor